MSLKLICVLRFCLYGLQELRLFRNIVTTPERAVWGFVGYELPAVFRSKTLRGSRVGQSVRPPTSAEVMIL